MTTQDLSVAGLSKGLFNDDGSITRSGMLFEVKRILTEAYEKGRSHLPTILLLENVPPLVSTSSKNGEKSNFEHFKEWLFYLEKLGYTSEWKKINSKDFGIPQNRERIFVISVLKGEDGTTYNYQFPKPKKLKLRLKDMLENKVDEKYYLSKAMVNYVTSRFPSGDHHITTGINIKNPNLDKVSGTLTTANGQRPSDTFICDENHYYDPKNGKMAVIDSYNKKLTDPNISGTIVCGQGKNQGSMIIEDIEIDVVGNYSKSGSYDASSIVNVGGVAPTVRENHGEVTAITERIPNYFSGGGRTHLKEFMNESQVQDLSKHNEEYKMVKPVTLYLQEIIKTQNVSSIGGYPDLRIRKLTPCECIKLMGFSRIDYLRMKYVKCDTLEHCREFDLLEKRLRNRTMTREEYKRFSVYVRPKYELQSDSQIWHEAGDSIVVQVLMQLFKQLI